MWAHVVDQADPISDGADTIYDWNGYDGSRGILSLPHYVEQNAERLRKTLISALVDLEGITYGGKTIVEHLETTDGFSLWWMGLLVEKSLPKSPRLFDCLRLLALEELLASNRPDGVVCSSPDAVVSDAVAVLCKKIDVKFRRAPTRRGSSRKKARLPRLLYDSLPSPVRGLVWAARYLANRWTLRRAYEGFSDARAAGDITVFSYFIHLNSAQCDGGTYSSRHWGQVSNLINQLAGGATWIHHYLESPEMPDKKTAIRWISGFNANAAVQGRHLFVDSYLSAALVMRVAYQYLRLCARAYHINGVSRRIGASAKFEVLWPALRKEFAESAYGPTALQNLFWYFLFDRSLAGLKKQRIGLYLHENQGWERAMVHVWRKHGHGRLIAVAHSTIRYWDLRYFEDRRRFSDSDRLKYPLPDQLALNGPLARQMIQGYGYPGNRLVDVEAQRFMNSRPIDRQSMPSETTASPQGPHGKRRRLLVLGDISRRATDAVLSLVQSCSTELLAKFSVTVKPHPGGKIATEEYAACLFDIVQEPISEIIERFDVVLTSNATSAVIDAVLANKRVLVHLSSGEPNLCPMSGLSGVRFVSNARELLSALEFDGPVQFAGGNPSIFWFDSELTRWRGILGSQGANPLSN